MPKVVRVEGAARLRSFIDLPFRLHAGDPVWVPPLRRDVRRLLQRGSNPFFEHAEAEYFLAVGDRGAEGRIAAIANHLHNDTHGDRVAFFGFFDSVDDPMVAAALFEAVATWAREREFDSLRGPVSPSVNDECGLLVEGFETPPTIMMPHNPPYYARLLEGAGLTGVKDLLVYHGGDPTRKQPVPERLTRATERMRQRLGVTLRPLEMSRFGDELETVRALFNASWSGNWGFVPFTEHEIEHVAAQFKPIVIPQLVPLAEKDGRPIGFGVAIPDLNEVLIHHRSGRSLPAVIRILWRLKRRRFRRLRILLLGIHPEFQGRGIDAILYHWIWTRGLEQGFRWGEAGWILEDNAAMNNALEKMTFSRYKTYRLYERVL